MAELKTLDITFQGICVHFHDVLAGIRHRAVLPNTLAVYFGTIQMPKGDTDVQFAPYYLMPHVPLVYDGVRIKVLLGALLEVTNAVGEYKFIPGGFRLQEFVPRFTFSEDVVLNGNASAYFDLSSGEVWTEGFGENPRITRVQVKTVGVPQLKITPFPGSPMHEETWCIDSGSLFVTNLDFYTKAEDTHFDFLLNYLVARGGIPRTLSQLVPGLTPDPAPLTMETLGRKLISLGCAVANTEPPLLELLPPPGNPIIAPVPFNQSCSDSHYP